VEFGASNMKLACGHEDIYLYHYPSIGWRCSLCDKEKSTPKDLDMKTEDKCTPTKPRPLLYVLLITTSKGFQHWHRFYGEDALSRAKAVKSIYETDCGCILIEGTTVT
jgi:hypothetical protein